MVCLVARLKLGWSEDGNEVGNGMHGKQFFFVEIYAVNM